MGRIRVSPARCNRYLIKRQAYDYPLTMFFHTARIFPSLAIEKLRRILPSAAIFSLSRLMNPYGQKKLIQGQLSQNLSVLLW